MLSPKNYYDWNYISTDKLIKIINDIPNANGIPAEPRFGADNSFTRILLYLYTAN